MSDDPLSLAEVWTAFAECRSALGYFPKRGLSLCDFKDSVAVRQAGDFGTLMSLLAGSVATKSGSAGSRLERIVSIVNEA